MLRPPAINKEALIDLAANLGRSLGAGRRGSGGFRGRGGESRPTALIGIENATRTRFSYIAHLLTLP